MLYYCPVLKKRGTVRRKLFKLFNIQCHKFSFSWTLSEDRQRGCEFWRKKWWQYGTNLVAKEANIYIQILERSRHHVEKF